FRMLFPNQVIRSDDLAHAMVDVVVRGTDKPESHILENRDIRAIVKSYQSSAHGTRRAPNTCLPRADRRAKTVNVCRYGTYCVLLRRTLLLSGPKRHYGAPNYNVAIGVTTDIDRHGY